MKKIVLKNFHQRLHGDTNLYESELGWFQRDYDDAMAHSPEDVLRYHLNFRYDMYFFYPQTMRWYCIDTCSGPKITLVLLKPKKDWDGKFLDDNVEPFSMNDEDLDILYQFDTVDEFIKGAVIDGEPISDVIAKSWIEFS